MRSTTIRVPEALLGDRRLGKPAKVIWLSLQLVGDRAPGTGGAAVPRTGLLLASSGLSRHTVLRSLAQLRAAGWLPEAGGAAQAIPAAAGPYTRFPAAVLADRHLGAQAKLLYATLARLARGACSTDPDGLRGTCSLAQLCEFVGASPNTVKRALRALRARGWLHYSQSHRLSPIAFRLDDPVAARQREAIARVEKLLRRGARGEALMRAFLTLLVDSEEYDDDASPGFLVNPFTNEEMQLDRYYPAAEVAFEFQGPQHYGPTELYPDETEALKQQARDCMKQLICVRRGIRLVVVHPADLTLERMRQKIAGLLPLRDLAGQEAVAEILERVSRGYRRRARTGDRPRD